MTTTIVLTLASLLFLPSATAQQSVDQSQPANPDATVDIDNLCGTLSVTGWNRAEVQVTGTLEDDDDVLKLTGSKGRIELGTHSGDVTVVLPGLEHAAYALSSFSGVIKGFLAHQAISGFGPGSNVAFVAGEGTTSVAVATHSGDIDIRND